MLTGQPLVADGTLVSNATGRFHTYPELLRRIVSGRISSVDVERECGIGEYGGRLRGLLPTRNRGFQQPAQVAVHDRIYFRSIRFLSEECHVFSRLGLVLFQIQNQSLIPLKTHNDLFAELR